MSYKDIYNEWMESSYFDEDIKDELKRDSRRSKTR